MADEEFKDLTENAGENNQNNEHKPVRVRLPKGEESCRCKDLSNGTIISRAHRAGSLAARLAPPLECFIAD